MTFYRVWYFTQDHAGRGYDWFTSRVEARRALTAWKRHQREEDEKDCEWLDAVDRCQNLGHAWGTVEVVDISPTKKGILAALNEHARHDVTEQ
jgi:transposase